MDQFDFFNAYATNEKAETEGSWVAHPASGNKFLIARNGNPRHTRMVNAQFQANRELLVVPDGVAEDDPIRDEYAKRDNHIMCNVMAVSILLGWEKPVNFQGEALTYSAANAAKLLAMPAFRDWVVGQSNRLANYLEVKFQEEAKNSATTISGTSSGVVDSSTSST